jgi:hypothetical protein
MSGAWLVSTRVMDEGGGRQKQVGGKSGQP